MLLPLEVTRCALGRARIEGDVAYRSAGWSAHIQPYKPCVICRW
uniref:Uncharacterized protein n=1 Tax=Siphoviridae sp. ctvI513 TaxID=2827965 RepID=A0A8S5TJ97_9CAUD|nr:MAG TPA: hypothetical protein [Siphoviridae sp. ctvI513]